MLHLKEIKITSKIISLIAVLLCTINLNAQNLEWANSFGGSNYDAATSTTIDANGNIYTTGVFSQTVDFDPSINTFNLTSNGEKDIFIQKLDSAGNFIWAIAISGDSSYCHAKTTIDEYGNIYVTGYFEGEFDFDPGIDTHKINSNGTINGFVLKLDSLTNFIWMKTIGEYSLNDECYCFDVYVKDTMVYIIGIFEGTIDFDPDSLGVFNISSYYQTDAFILKIDTSANFIWAKALQSNSRGNIRSISLDSNNNIYLAGTFTFVVDFDPGASTTSICAQSGYDSYVLKLDAQGNFVWVRVINGTSNVNLYQMVIDPAGYIYSVGQFFETIDLDPSSATNYFTSAGSLDIFIQKLDFSGNLIWAKSYGDYAYDENPRIAIDDNSNIYTLGLFYDSIDINPGAGVFMLNSATNYFDFFIQKLDPAGNFIWGNSFGGEYNKYPASIVLDPHGNIYASGNYFGSIDVDPGQGQHILNPNGGDDIFVIKLNDCVSTGIDSITSCNSYTWINGNTYTASNNSAMYSFNSANGCDSIVSLNLTIILINTTLSLTGSTINSHALNATYQWVDCDNNYAPIIGETMQSFSPTINGRYAVILTENGCIDTSQCADINNVFIDDNFIKNHVNIYPNPSNGIVNIDLVELQNCSIKVFNAFGQSIHEKLNVESNIYQVNINKAGIYIIEVCSNDKKAFFKLIID